MKKFILSLALVVPMVFTSCGDDNDDATLSLDKGSVEINYGGNTTIKASEKNCTWSSSNEFVATVDQDGKVTAQHVGEAKITASKDGLQASCVVTVNATNFNYIMPYTVWGASIADVKSYMSNISGPTLGVDTDDALGYATNGDFPIYTYAFINKGLGSSALYVEDTDDNIDGLSAFLKQRYAVYGEDDETGSIFLCNANSTGSATTFIEFGYDADMDGIMVVCVPRMGTKGASADQAYISETIKLHNNIAKELKK